jgi:hypothetical protein
MDVEPRLRGAGLPDVSVDAERALSSTLARGTARGRRRTVAGALGAAALVVVTVIVVVGIARNDGGEDLDLATGSSVARATSVPSALPVQPVTTVPPGSQVQPVTSVSPTPEPGDPATWDIDHAAPPTSGSSTFTALVTRLACSGGKTGRVLRPGVVVNGSEIVITFTVATLPDGGYNCLGNDAVPYVVDVGGPIGTRSLVDGACTAGGKAASTSFCSSTASPGVRWRADGAAVLAGNFSVTGRLVSVGGPAGAAVDVAGGTVQALDAAGVVVAADDTDADGAFQLLLPNGTYRLVGRSSLYQAGQVDCTAEAEVVVHDRYVEAVTVACHRK